jgi:cytochrome c oxidase cbb3-type subunit 3
MKIRVRVTLLAVALAATGGCQREARLFEPAAGPAITPPPVRMSDLQPAQSSPPPSVAPRYEVNAAALASGKRLFTWYNCNGCHANGGGDKGPALMDDVWIYGGEPANIYMTIVEGRPNGMPSYGGHIPDEHVWQLVAYVRSMSGLVPVDAAPGRDDAIQSGPAESRRTAQPPVPAAVPPSAQQSK